MVNVSISISELTEENSTILVPSTTMGPLPGTFDVRSTNTTEWPSQDQNNKEVVKNGMTTKLKNKLWNKKSKASLCKTAVNAPVNTDVDLPDLIIDSANTGKVLKKVQIPVPQRAHYIVQACVSGFVPLRHRIQQEINDMAYVVDVTWSDGRTHMVKRTFTDFNNFHFYLLDEWGTKDCKEGPLRLTFYLPGWYFIILYFQ